VLSVVVPRDSIFEIRERNQAPQRCRLMVDSEERTLVLTGQFRFPAFVNGLTDGLPEACELLDGDT
jgi:hypothetical protein